MLDVATLAVNVETTDLKDGRADMDAFTASGARAERQTQKVTTATKGMGGAARIGTGGFRNLGLQLNQVAQVGGMTGNWMQAIAVQLPDMLLGFGSIGIAAGIAAGAMIPLVSSLASGTDEVLEFDDALANVNDTIDNLIHSQEMLRMDTDDLVQVYGEAAEAVRFWAQKAAELQVSQSGRVLADNVDYAREMIDVYGKGVTVMDDFGRASDDISGNIRAIQADFEVTAGQAYLLYNEFSALSDPSLSPDQMADSLTRILSTLEDSGVALNSIPDEIQDMISEMIAFSTATAQAAEQARQLSASVAGISVGMPLFDQGFEGNELLPPKGLPNPRGRQRSRSGGGGSRIDPAEREAQRIFDQTRTAAERYAIELARLDELLVSTNMTQDTYNRAVEQAEEKYKNAQDAANEWTGANDLLKDSFLQLAMDGGDAMDAIGNAIRRAALEAALFGEGPLGGLFAKLGGEGGLFGAIGNLLGFSSGGYTGSGNPNDPAGIVHKREYVLDAATTERIGVHNLDAMRAGASWASGYGSDAHVGTQGGGQQITYAPTINMPGATAEAVARMEGVLAKDRAEFEARTIKTVLSARKRRIL